MYHKLKVPKPNFGVKSWLGVIYVIVVFKFPNHNLGIHIKSSEYLSLCLKMIEVVSSEKIIVNKLSPRQFYYCYLLRFVTTVYSSVLINNHHKIIFTIFILCVYKYQYKFSIIV